MKFKKSPKKDGGVAVQIDEQDANLVAYACPPRAAFKLKRILVPLDFSACSQKALQYAVPLARQFDAELELLHVVEPYPPIAELTPVTLETTEDGRQDLERVRKSIPGEVSTRTSVRSGAPAGEIVDAANDLAVDLIVISTHGRTGLAHALMGSTTEKVVRHARCPVLVVREREQEFIH